ncbi:PRC-barrel domain-containing protein [Desulfospira joergensenii]|uniref:PRC-barrel domain-containing protein n=1 Tax=Desulfospira joergensenii TaxID=53329 RepID=UPI0003B56BDE|nr:PRC-barrel domain-containing protein [Desulfospira joergensenii]
MLRSVNQMIGYRLNATDDELGKCRDLLFDDRWWTIRHLLADTGTWMSGKQVLISPMMILKPDWESRKIFLKVPKKTVENCPVSSADEPVSREYEKKMALYYGYPGYWAGESLWGPAASPAALEQIASQVAEKKAKTKPEETEDPEESNHLRSFDEVKGYRIHAADGSIGHVDDFIVDDETWALRHVVVDTGNWLPGRRVLLSLDWAKDVDWDEQSLTMDLTKDEIKNSPEFDPEKPVNKEYETRLYDFYGRPVEHNINKRIQQQIANPFI